MEATTLLQAYQAKDLKTIQSILAATPSTETCEELSSFLKEGQVDLEKRLKSIVFSDESEEAENFKGLRFLHENFDVKMLNTLPDTFADSRDKIAFTIATAGRDLASTNLPLSIALLSYAGKLHVTNKKLKKQIDWLLSQKNYEKRQHHISADRDERKKTRKTYFAIALVLVSVTLLGIRLNRTYQEWQAEDEFAENFEGNVDAPAVKRTSNAPRTRAGEEAKWFQTERTLAAGFEYGDEYVSILKARGNVRTELREKGFLFGNNPMDCYQTAIFNGLRSTKSIVIHGDKKHDAVLFLQWENQIGRQVFIPKKTSFYVFINRNKEITASVIFGNDWDENLENPCGGKGFFSKDVIYAPDHSHATVPRDINTKEKFLNIRLRHNKMLPAEKTTEKHFMRILEDFK